MKRIITAVSTVILMSTMACSTQEEPAQEQPQKELKSVSPFTPTSSGMISANQATIWSKANTKLDSLLMVSTNIEEKSQSISVEEKDRLCRNAGFSGGYSEYQWVSKMITKAVNRPLLDSLHKQTL